jgi:hypothetical protein
VGRCQMKKPRPFDRGIRLARIILLFSRRGGTLATNISATKSGDMASMPSHYPSLRESSRNNRDSRYRVYLIKEASASIEASFGVQLRFDPCFAN